MEGTSLVFTNLGAGAVFDISGLGSFNPRVRSVSWSPDGTRILVGTIGCEIYEISAGDGSNFFPGPLTQGHCRHQLWGLSMSPTKPEFCTVGDDQSVRVMGFEDQKSSENGYARYHGTFMYVLS